MFLLLLFKHPQILFIEINYGWFMVFNATYISAVSWQSVLLVEETGVPRENN